jgi:hypothetical protein
MNINNLFTGVDYSQFNLNSDPAYYGLSAGEYEPSKKAFIGLGSWQSMSLNAGRVQLSPPGILLPYNGGVGNFVNNSGSIWYLRPRSTQNFSWVTSQNGDTVDFAVDFGTNSSGTPYYFGRIVTSSPVLIGIVPLYMGRIFYVDENGKFAYASSGYEVLTCKSSIGKKMKNETVTFEKN